MNCQTNKIGLAKDIFTFQLKKSEANENFAEVKTLVLCPDSELHAFIFARVNPKEGKHKLNLIISPP